MNVESLEARLELVQHQLNLFRAATYSMGHINGYIHVFILTQAALSRMFIRNTCGMESMVHMHGPS